MDTRLPNVLVVDDDVLVLSALERLLRPLHVHRATDVRTALAMCDLHGIGVAITDYQLKGSETGTALCKRLRSNVPDIVVALLTGFPSMQIGFDAAFSGIQAVFQKPISGTAIKSWIQTANEHRQQSPDTLASIHASHIARTLERCRGNRSEAARQLGIRRTSLQRMLKKLPPASG